MPWSGPGAGSGDGFPAFLVGAASPLMIRFAVGTHESWSRESGTAYALNTAGAVAGSLVAGFGLLPSLSAKGAVAVAAGLQVIVALMFIRTAKRFGAEGFVPALGIAGVVAAIAAFASVQAASPLLNLSLTRAQSASAAQLIDIARASKPVYFRDTAAGRVAVYQLPDGRYVLGHPAYYPRFGFSTGQARLLQHPFSPDAYMALALSPDALDGVSGRVRYPREIAGIAHSKAMRCAMVGLRPGHLTVVGVRL